MSSLPPPPRLLPAFIESGPAPPAGYGEDRVVAMVRDPRCLYVYWELGGHAYRKAESRHGPAELAKGVWVLRVEHCRRGVSRPRPFEVPVDPGAGNWYLHVEPASIYRVQIGVVLPSGLFVGLATSRTVMTPPESASVEADDDWQMTIEQFEQMVLGVMGDAPIGSSQLVRALGRMTLGS